MTKPQHTLPELTPQETARFWSKVDKSGDCWLWLGGKTHGTYGVFSVSRDKKQRHLIASRVAYELTYGPLGPDRLACHTCDTPDCVRPDHLFSGTNADNTQDMIAKGRWSGQPPVVPLRGEHNPLAKLTDEKVREILRLSFAGTMTRRQIAARFGVSLGLVDKIRQRKVWRHVTEVYNPDAHSKECGVMESLTICLPLPYPLLTINWRRRHHWRVQSRHTGQQRGDASWCALLALPLFFMPPYFSGRVRVDVEVRPRRRQKRCDDTALWEAMKPTLDGFEDAQVVGDDKQFTIGTLTWSTERTGELVVRLTQEV